MDSPKELQKKLQEIEKERYNLFQKELLELLKKYGYELQTIPNVNIGQGGQIVVGATIAAVRVKDIEELFEETNEEEN